MSNIIVTDASNVVHFHSCDFHPCDLVPRFPFPLLQSALWHWQSAMLTLSQQPRKRLTDLKMSRCCLMFSGLCSSFFCGAALPPSIMHAEHANPSVWMTCFSRLLKSRSYSFKPPKSKLYSPVHPMLTINYCKKLSYHWEAARQLRMRHDYLGWLTDRQTVRQTDWINPSQLIYSASAVKTGHYYYYYYEIVHEVHNKNTQNRR